MSEREQVFAEGRIGRKQGSLHRITDESSGLWTESSKAPEKEGRFSDTIRKSGKYFCDNPVVLIDQKGMCQNKQTKKDSGKQSTALYLKSEEN